MRLLFESVMGIALAVFSAFPSHATIRLKYTAIKNSVDSHALPQPHAPYPTAARTRSATIICCRGVAW